MIAIIILPEDLEQSPLQRFLDPLPIPVVSSFSQPMDIEEVPFKEEGDRRRGEGDRVQKQKPRKRILYTNGEGHDPPFFLPREDQPARPQGRGDEPKGQRGEEGDNPVWAAQE